MSNQNRLGVVTNSRSGEQGQKGRSEKTALLHLLMGGDLGGLERCVLEFSRHIDLDRYDMTVVFMNRSGPMTDQIDRRKIRVLEFNCKHFLHLSGFLRFFLFMRRNKFDIAHNNIHSIPMNLALMCLRDRPILVCHEHGMELLNNSMRARLFYWMFRHMYDSFIAVNDDMMQWMKKRVGVADERISVINNAVDVTSFIPKRARGDGKSGGRWIPTIGVVARLVKEKDFDLFLDAAEQVLQERPQVKFVIVGSGPLEGELRQIVREPRFRGMVYMTGGTTNVDQELWNFDLYLFTSRVESFGITILEALSCGVPVLAALPEVGGARSLLRSLDGVTVLETRDPFALARTALRLLAAPQELRILGQAGRKQVVSQYSVVEWTRKIDGLYQGLLKLRSAV